MPDQIVEFLHDTLTYAELAAGVDVVVNAANEQATIKDIFVVGADDGTFSLKDGTTTIAQTKNNIHLSGAELIGESTTIKLYITSSNTSSSWAVRVTGIKTTLV